MLKTKFKEAITPIHCFVKLLMNSEFKTYHSKFILVQVSIFVNITEIPDLQYLTKIKVEEHVTTNFIKV